jgi:uncharacterized protein (DUF433 family)
MYIFDTKTSRWTLEQINEYYLQKVYREFPTVKAIRQYMMGSRRGQVVTQQATQVARGPRNGSVGGELDKYLARAINDDNNKTDHNDKALENLRRIKRENIERAKKFYSKNNQDELKKDETVSETFKKVEPTDTRKNQNQRYIYAREDFQSEAGYRDYIINDDLTDLIPSQMKSIGIEKMRGYPGRLSKQHNSDSKPNPESSQSEDQYGKEKPIPGSEYKETVDPDEVTHEAEEKHNKPSTMEINASTGSVAFNSQHILFKKVRLAELNIKLDNLEAELKKLEEEEMKTDYDSLDFDEVQKKIGRKRREYNDTLSEYNALVNSIEDFR